MNYHFDCVIIWSSINDLDEAAGAYKNIEAVMDNQKDLVKIVTKLFPLAVIKG